MEKSKIALIGGSGIYKFDEVKLIEEIEINTPFGKPSDNILLMSAGGNQFYFLPRHGRDHKFNPSEINYRANIYALKSLGVETIVSVSAVGSLKDEHFPSKFVLVDQFIDWTKGKRSRTFFENGVVGHVSTAYPVDRDLVDVIERNCKKENLAHSRGGTYICIEGPQFSSKAESNLYRTFGVDVIGMTNVPESYLAREAGISYATIAMITDYDCFKEVHCTVEEIMKVMKDNYLSVQKLLPGLISDLTKNPIKRKKENVNAVMTSEKFMTSEQKSIIKVLLN